LQACTTTSCQVNFIPKGTNMIQLM
jgi:hypothetical protein